MEARGIDQTQLAKGVGVTWAAAHRWVTGQAQPSGANLRKIAEVLGVDVTELLGIYDGQHPPFDAWHDFLRTPEGRGASEDELRSLAGLPWPPGRSPTVGAYQAALVVLRMTVPRNT